MRWRVAPALALALAAGSGCGGEADGGTAGFTACGGDLIGSWSFSSATLLASGDGCDAGGGPAIDGFFVFNAGGRYSLNAGVSAWKRTQDEPCGFRTADGGFHRASGASVCIAGTEAELAAAACDGAAPILETPLRGAAEYCVEGTALRLRTSTMLGLRFPALLELRKM